MKFSFLHLADVHLGNAQYGRKERADDFARAFYFAVEYAVRRKVDFVLVAGDLFERSNLDPMTFDQALFGLEDLRKAGIPVIDIAGNHDRARYGQGRGWLESLALHGFLYHLDASANGTIQLSPWSEDDRTGGYLDLKGVRFVGMRYLGSSTARAVEELGVALLELAATDRPYTVLLLHAGLEGVIPNFRAELTHGQLAPLKGLVDYVALGHVHQHYSRDDWLYNPGSLETYSAGEVGWERGLLHVTVDDSAEVRQKATLIAPPRRPFLRFRLEVERCTQPEELVKLVRDSAHKWANEVAGQPAVVHVTLVGRLRFDRRELDLATLESALEEIMSPLVIQIRDQTDETAFQVQGNEEGAAVDRAALEINVLRQIFANDERRVDSAREWAGLAQTLKQGALSKEAPEELAKLLRREISTLDKGDRKRDPCA